MKAIAAAKAKIDSIRITGSETRSSPDSHIVRGGGGGGVGVGTKVFGRKSREIAAIEAQREGQGEG